MTPETAAHEAAEAASITVEGILRELRQLQGDKDWSTQKAKDEKYEAMYYGDDAYTVEAIKRTSEMLIDPTKHVVKQGAARDIVDQMTGLKLIPPRHSIDAPGIGTSKQEHAEKIEDWLNEVGPLLESQQGEDTNAMLTAEVDLYGYTGRCVLPDVSRWQGRPGRDDFGEGAEGDLLHTQGLDEYHQTAPVPILDEHISAVGWYPVLDGRTVIRSYEVTSITRAAALARYGYEESHEGSIRDASGRYTSAKDENESIELVRYIDDTYVAIICTEDKGEFVVEPWEHHMPMDDNVAPVVLYEGILTPSRKPGRRWSSILEALYDTLKTQDMVLTRQRVMVAAFYMATLIEEVEKEAVVDTLSQNVSQLDSDFLLGAANEMAPGRKVRLLDQPRNLPDAELLWDKCQKRVDAAFPEVLRGIIPGQTSGYLFNLARDNALARHNPVSSRIARGDAESAGLRLKAIGAIEEMLPDAPPVAVRRRKDKGTEAIELTWEDCRDYAQLIECARDAQLPVDQLANLQAAKEAHEFGLPWAWATRTYMKLENPAELRLERMAENLENSEEMVARTNEDIMRRLQIISDTKDGMPAGDAARMPLPPAMRKAMRLPDMPPPPTGPRGEPIEGADMAPPPPKPRGGGGGGGGGRRRNPRAGQRSQPGGQRRRGTAPQPSGRSP